MRGLVLVVGIIFSQVLAASEAFAAEARTGRSGLVVGLFLGFCALIVVAQLLPALRSRLLERQQRISVERVKTGGDH
jgi:predicted cobalt transporter CbtA